MRRGDPPARGLRAAALAEVAAEVEKALRQGEGREAPPILPAGGHERVPLSFAQQRLWILDQMEPGLTAYNLPLAVRLDGRLQREALRRSLGEIVRRHEALRTGFEWLDGVPVQAVNPPEDLALPLVDLSALPAGRGMEETQRLAAAEAARPFSLEWDPLLRLRWWRWRPSGTCCSSPCTTSSPTAGRSACSCASSPPSTGRPRRQPLAAAGAGGAVR